MAATAVVTAVMLCTRNKFNLAHHRRVIISIAQQGRNRVPGSTKVCNRLNAEDALMRARRHKVSTYEHNTLPKPHAVDVIRSCINVCRGRGGIRNNNDMTKTKCWTFCVIFRALAFRASLSAAANVSSIFVTSETPLVSARARPASTFLINSRARCSDYKSTYADSTRCASATKHISAKCAGGGGHSHSRDTNVNLI